MSQGFHINPEARVLPCSTTPEKCDFPGGQFSTEEEAYASSHFKRVLGDTALEAITLKKIRMQQRLALMKKSHEGEVVVSSEEIRRNKKTARHVAHDLELSWGEISPNQKTITIFRSGVPEAIPSAEWGIEASSYETADKVCPEGRTGRSEGFCASPTLGGVARWVKANTGIAAGQIKDPAPLEMKVDLDTTYIYEVSAWERASNIEESQQQTAEENVSDQINPYASYWETGVTLREFTSLVKDDPVKYDPTKWEILVTPDELTGKPKKISYDRVATAMHTDYDSDREKMKALKRRK